MTRVTLDAVTINDQDSGLLPVAIYDNLGNQIGYRSNNPLYSVPQTAFSRTTWLASTIITANGQTAAQAFNNNRLATFVVNVTAVSGTSPTLTLALQDSNDGGSTYDTIFTFTQITTAGTYVINLGDGTGSTNSIVFSTNMRISYTVGGTTPSFTTLIRSISQL